MYIVQFQNTQESLSAADPGFARDLPITKVEAPTYYFPQKLQENEKKLDPEGRGGHIPGAPLGSANGSFWMCLNISKI